MRIQRMLGGALLALLLLLCGNALGQEAATYTISVEVVRQDPDNPDAFIPVEGIYVAMHPSLNWDTPIYLKTDAQGKVQYTNQPQGLVNVFLPDVNNWLSAAGLVEYGTPYFWDDYIWDEQATYIALGEGNPTPSLRFILREKTNDGTGGFRAQKAYYPYHYTSQFESFMGTVQNYRPLNIYSGPQVAGAQFILSFFDETGVESVTTYYTQDGSFSTQREDALVLTTDESGQIFVDGLLPGPYLLEEITPLPGTVLPVAPYTYIWIRPDEISFLTDGSLINSPEHFSVYFNKVDEQGNMLTGGKFIIYREGLQGEREYLNYILPFSYQGAAIEEYTADINKAYVFTALGKSGHLIMDYSTYKNHPFSFFVAGLEPGFTYYLHEVEAPVGHLPLTEDIPFTQANGYQVTEQESINGKIIQVVNKRDINTTLLIKTADQGDVQEEETLPGAGFVLARLSAQGISFLTGGATVDAVPVFGEEIAVADPGTFFTGKTQADVAALANNYIHMTQAPDGILALVGLPAGDYRLLEVVTPEGYVETLTMVDFTIEKGQPHPTLQAENTLKDNTAVLRKVDK